MNTSDSNLAISASYVKAWGKLDAVKKDVTNTFFKSKYADLSSVLDMARPVLSEHGLALLTPITIREGVLCVETKLLHESGEWMASEIGFALADHKPQTVGSTATYARRYAVMAFLNIASEDDDGNAASGRQTPPPVPAKVPPKAPPTPAPAPPATPPPAAAAAPAPAAAAPAPAAVIAGAMAGSDAAVAPTSETLRDAAVAELNALLSVENLTAEQLRDGALAKANQIKKTWPGVDQLEIWKAPQAAFKAHHARLKAGG